MGDFDDAIREHLELKRQHGASEEEVTIKEREAKKSGALPSEPGEALAEPGPAAPAGTTEVETSEEPSVSPAEPPPLVSPAEPPPADEPEPDEVLPEEALEVPEDEREDVLEETPELLEDLPEQDRLWFEQRPPKDFDFDD
jgi:hypothetical protein